MVLVIIAHLTAILHTHSSPSTNLTFNCCPQYVIWDVNGRDLNVGMLRTGQVICEWPLLCMLGTDVIYSQWAVVAAAAVDLSPNGGRSTGVTTLTVQCVGLYGSTPRIMVL